MSLRSVFYPFRKGAVFIEASTLVVVSLLIGFVGAPMWVEHKIGKNERSAIAMLRRIAADEACFKKERLNDMNSNRVGEYGFLSDLVRLRPVQIDPETQELAEVSRYCGVDCRDGILTRDGYHFLIYLPDAKGRGNAFAPECCIGRPINAEDAEADEQAWCCYAWPVRYGTTGKRTFFINQSGEIHATDQIEGVRGNTPYSAKDRVPDPEAAFVPETEFHVMIGTLACDAPAKDRETWTKVD